MLLPIPCLRLRCFYAGLLKMWLGVASRLRQCQGIKAMKKVSNYDTRPSMAIPQVHVKPESASEPNMTRAALTAVWQSISRKWIAISCLLIGAVFGLTVLGWYVWPVEWTGGSYQHLTAEDQALLIELATDLNVYDVSNPALVELQRRWPEIDELACFVASQQV